MDEEREIVTAETLDGHWLILSYANNPVIRLDGRLLDRVAAFDSDLVLDVDGMTVRLTTTSEHCALAIAQGLSSYTRMGPISNETTYADAKRRLELLDRGRRCNGSLSLFLGDRDVFVSDDDLMLGDTLCSSVREVVRAARANEDLILTHGRIQAALVMLVVAAHRRNEDADVLREKIAVYETVNRLGSSDDTTSVGSSSLQVETG